MIIPRNYIGMIPWGHCLLGDIASLVVFSFLLFSYNPILSMLLRELDTDNLKGLKVSCSLQLPSYSGFRIILTRIPSKKYFYTVIMIYVLLGKLEFRWHFTSPQVLQHAPGLPCFCFALSAR